MTSGKHPPRKRTPRSSPEDTTPGYKTNHLAVAPDAVHQIRDLGIPPAYVAQNTWDELFIGGTTLRPIARTVKPNAEAKHGKSQLSQTPTLRPVDGTFGPVSHAYSTDAETYWPRKYTETAHPPPNQGRVSLCLPSSGQPSYVRTALLRQDRPPTSGLGYPSKTGRRGCHRTRGGYNRYPDEKKKPNKNRGG